MIDFATARRMMVDGQIRPADVTDPRLIAAMLELPREKLLPPDQASLAYLDREVPLGGMAARRRRSLKPMVLAKLIQVAEVAETDRVLDVGCGTGYSTALLGRLAASVVGLEVDAALSRSAMAALAVVGANNVTIVTGPLDRGWPDRAPYDLIVLQGAVEIAPKALFGQLKSGGRLVCVVGQGPAAKATVFHRAGAGPTGARGSDRAGVHGSGMPEVHGSDMTEVQVFDANAAPLPGFSPPASFVF